jgi:hypothetical protein
MAVSQRVGQWSLNPTRERLLQLIHAFVRPSLDGTDRPVCFFTYFLH